jgi:hypothetical protein
MFTPAASAGLPPRRSPPKQRRSLESWSWHGACAEMGCLTQALDAGIDPAGAFMRAVAIGSSNPGHGLPKVICGSCSVVLDTFGVNR